MGTYDTAGGSARHDPAFDRGDISDFEEQAALQLETFERLADELHIAKVALTKTINQVLNKLMPVGTIIDNRERGAPTWQRAIRVASGNARGAHRFEIAGPISAHMDTSHPTLSKWTAHAYALSQHTGARMSGRVHGADGQRPTVTISACVCEVPDTELRGDAFGQFCNDELMKVIGAAGDVK